MNKFIEILIGLVFLIVPVYAWIVDFAGFGSAALVLLKGGLVWVVVFVGLVFLAAGLNGLKED